MRVSIGLNMSSHKIIKVWPLANEHVRLGKKKTTMNNDVMLLLIKQVGDFTRFLF